MSTGHSGVIFDVNRVLWLAGVRSALAVGVWGDLLLDSGGEAIAKPAAVYCRSVQVEVPCRFHEIAIGLLSGGAQ